jgi:hypothetical protein
MFEESEVEYGAVIDSLHAAADERPVTKILYSRRDAAFALSMSLRSLDCALAAGELKYRKAGRKVLIPATSLHTYARQDHAELTRRTQ